MTSYNRFTFFLFFTIISSGVVADYIPAGSFYGFSNGSVIVKRFDDIVAMEDKDGNRYNLPDRYKDVSSYNGKICTINVRMNESGGNLLGIVVNKMFQKAFYLKFNDGQLERVDIDILNFPCKKVE